MATPGKKLGAIQPNETVTIFKNGDAKPPNVTVYSGDVVEFQTDKNNSNDWVVQFQDVDGNDLFPLEVYVAGGGSGTFTVVNYAGAGDVTIPFDVIEYAAGQQIRKRGPAPMGKYTITINSGGRRKK
jgi:hypothetical protein